MSMPGLGELILILVVLVLLFGAGRIPRLMKDVAEGVKSFRKGLKDDDSTASSEKTEESKTSDTDKSSRE